METPVPIPNTVVKHCYVDDSRFQLGPAKVDRRQFIVEEFLYYFADHLGFSPLKILDFLGRPRCAVRSTGPDGLRSLLNNTKTSPIKNIFICVQGQVVFLICYTALI